MSRSKPSKVEAPRRARRRIWVLPFALGACAIGMWACAEEPCDAGDSCSKECNQGEVALCVAKGLCQCSPGGVVVGDGGIGGSLDGGTPADCRAARIGDLVINEVVVDGVSPDDENEFIELVSTANEPVYLGGLSVTGLKGGNPSAVITFTGGCFPARGAVAMFSKLDRWIAPAPISGLAVTLKAFGFTNSAPFSFQLLSPNGAPWSTLAGGAELIDENVSITRVPDLVGEMLGLHDALYGSDQSPGVCPNGGAYHLDCEGGPPPGDMGAGGMDGGRIDMMVPIEVCDPPRVGELVINELLIDGAAANDADEFVELLNLADRPVSLVGVTLADGRATPPGPEVVFTDGCVPPRGAFAVRKAPADTWIWTPAPARFPGVSRNSLGLTNGGDVVALLGVSGEELDRVTVQGDPRVPPSGISLVRDPEGTGPLRRHDEVVPGRGASPGRCANGGRHDEGCIATEVDMGVDMGPATDGGGGSGGGGDMGPAADLGPQCDPPMLGDLVVNEALVDGNEGGTAETDEFVEVVNVGDRPVNLTGLRVQHGDDMAVPSDLLRFVSGCMPPRSAVAARRSAAAVVWSSGLPFAEVVVSNNRFTNSRVRHDFLLVDAAGNELSRLEVPRAAVAPGVSANRDPDLSGVAAVLHTVIQPGVNSSPARCPNGGAYADDCIQ
jgi:hypothetical protein